MGYSLIATTIKGGTGSTVTSDPANTTGADLIVVEVAHYAGGATPTLSDSLSNTWTSLTEFTSTSGIIVRTQLFYCHSPTVGAAHTFTVTSSSGVPSVAAMAFSGSAASPYTQENGLGGATGTTIQPGSLTPAGGGHLLVAGLVFGSGVSPTGSAATIDGGFTGVSLDYAPGTSMGIGMAYLIQGSAAAANPTWTWGATMSCAAGMADFAPLSFTQANRSPSTLMSPGGFSVSGEASGMLRPGGYRG